MSNARGSKFLSRRTLLIAGIASTQFATKAFPQGLASQADNPQDNAGIPIVTTIAAARSVQFPESIRAILIQRYSDQTPYRPTLYKVARARPSHALCFENPAGRWWAVESGPIHASSAGAIGDGVTDDSEALQRALDTGLDVDISSASYLILKPPLVMRTPGQTLLSSDIPAAVGTPRNLGNLKCGVIGATLLRVETHNASFLGLRLEASANESRSDVPSIGIDFKPSRIGGGDVDTTIERCHFKHFTTGVRLTGRGLAFLHNACEVLGVGIELDWPMQFTERDALQTRSTGFRAMRIVNNRFHGVRFACTNSGANRKNLTSVQISSNNIDVGSGLFSGSLKNSIITDNVVNNARSLILDLRDSENCIIANTVMSGINNTEKNQKPNNIVKISGIQSLISFQGCIIGSPARNPILFEDAVASGVSFNNCSFITLLNNGQLWPPVLSIKSKLDRISLIGCMIQADSAVSDKKEKNNLIARCWIERDSASVVGVVLVDASSGPKIPVAESRNL